MDFLKKILNSKIFKLIFSVILIYFAFRKVNVWHLINEIRVVPIWEVVVILFFLGLMMFIGGVRWAILVLPNPSWKDFWAFTKAGYSGAFYSLFFPSTVGGDLVKWLPLMDKYKEVSKTTIAGSVLIDRVIGFTAFAFEALLALLLGKWLKYSFPDFLLWLFLAINIGVLFFYILVFTINFDKLIGKIKWLSKILEVVDFLKNENKKRILICLAISLVAEPLWLLPNYFYGLMFGVGASLLSVYIYLPIIALILVLPISIAGFGARENLFLFFFSQIGLPDEKILLMSTFNGIMLVLNSLVGGITLIL